MTYKISFPECFVCGTKEEVYQCPACMRFACAPCTNYALPDQGCQHELKATSEVSKWTSKPAHSQ